MKRRETERKIINNDRLFSPPAITDETAAMSDSIDSTPIPSLDNVGGERGRERERELRAIPSSYHRVSLIGREMHGISSVERNETWANVMRGRAKIERPCGKHNFRTDRPANSVSPGRAKLNPIVSRAVVVTFIEPR